ncbi:hypothetical protein HDU88_008521 [Geranomyces variabilis]|nr:hypothetical protein HDU88_008521 [Geranomyces variabilis]
MTLETPSDSPTPDAPPSDLVLVCRSCGQVLEDEEKAFRKHLRADCASYMRDRQQPPLDLIRPHQAHLFELDRFKLYCHICPPLFSGRGRFDGCFNNVYDMTRHEWRKHKTYRSKDGVLVLAPPLPNNFPSPPSTTPTTPKPYKVKKPAAEKQPRKKRRVSFDLPASPAPSVPSSPKKRSNKKRSSSTNDKISSSKSKKTSRSSSLISSAKSEYNPESPGWSPTWSPFDPSGENAPPPNDYDHLADTFSDGGYSDTESEHESCCELPDKLSDSEDDEQEREEADQISGLLWTPKLWVPARVKILPCPPRAQAPDQSFPFAGQKRRRPLYT